MPSKEVLCENLNHLTHRHKDQQLIFFGDYYIEFDMYFFHMNFITLLPKPN